MTARGHAVYLIAGEPSGDRLGARLMAALRRQDGSIRYLGVGGVEMAAVGLRSRFPITDLSVMGLAEVVPHLPRLIVRLRQTIADIRRHRPDVVVTIDSPDFTLRVARAIRREGIPVVHYVAPQVWAHRPNRVHGMATYLDHVLALLPFEPPLFQQAGLPCTFVGHPAVEDKFGQGDGTAFRARHGLGAGGPILAVLAGSRRSEVSRLLPVFGATVARLQGEIPNLALALPTVPAVEALVRAAAAGWPVPTVVTISLADKVDAFAAATAALAASGTVTLELGLSGVPMVIAYRTTAVTAWLARRLVRVRHVGLVNLIGATAVVPELLQEACEPMGLAAALLPLLRGREQRHIQAAALAGLRAAVAGPSCQPSEEAARIVRAVVAAGSRRVRSRNQGDRE